MIPVLTQAQRDCLARAKMMVEKGCSLIPAGATYKTQRIAYDNTVRLSAYSNMHGLRHAYAQDRYEILTSLYTKGHGWKAPIVGGPSRKELNNYEKKVDYQARMTLSFELGHSRENITRSYLG
jgi:hypothetical protein